MGVCSSKVEEDKPKTTSPKPKQSISVLHVDQPPKAVVTPEISSQPTSKSTESGPDGGSKTINRAPATDVSHSATYEPREDEPSFSLSVKYPKEDDIEELTINSIYAGMTVSQLKYAIYRQPKIKDITARIASFDPVTSVMLIYNTRPMDDAEKIQDYGLEGNGEAVTYILST
eukprot:TRINITY_DN3592_c0_g1_i1.p1 TRINITY_DN3592_c0_g1~~TRINITY_DN3592_c0_g1_i1.p1  ORF type:complete len:173 (+),score=15.13 TRINITY_DN3592_c0_g1_i1:69-587(+)